MWWKLLLLGLGASVCLVNAERTDEKVDFSSMTVGSSGVGCTKQGRKCVYNATCENHTCRCPPNLRGQAEIECVNKDKVLCYIAADPHIVAFGNAQANLAFPCRFRATRFVTGYANGLSRFGTCSFEVWATNVFFHGRYVIRSVHASVGISDPVQQVHTTTDIFKEGTVEAFQNGQLETYSTNDSAIYKYQARVSYRDNIWGSSEHQNINGIDVNPSFDDVNNFAIIDVPACGVRIKYRAFDPRRAKHQKQLPGITIMAPRDAYFHESMGDYPTSVCGTPDDSRSLYKDRAEALGLNDADTAVLYDILGQKSVQDNTNPLFRRCEKAFQVFKNSDNPVDHTNSCAFLLVQPEVGKCVEAEGVQPIDAFIGCLNIAQKNNEPGNGCLRYKRSARACGGLAEWSGLKANQVVCPASVGVEEDTTEGPQ